MDHGVCVFVCGLLVPVDLDVRMKATLLGAVFLIVSYRHHHASVIMLLLSFLLFVVVVVA